LVGDANGNRTGEIARQSLAKQVAAQLRDDIVRDYLHAGEPLPSEKVLATQFGVSRTVIREALNQLATKGLVNVVHGKGSTVAAKDVWHIVDTELLKGLGHSPFELIELRKILEVEAAGLAADRATDEDLQAIGEAIRRYEEAFEHPERRLEADIDFHAAIIRSTKNRLLAIVLEPVSELLRSSRMITLSVPSGAAKSRAAHRRVWEALQQRNAVKARQAMCQHLEEVMEDLRAAAVD
jgi:GntR family transcriptional repressor for pyruvate dehydrogenase complex